MKNFEGPRRAYGAAFSLSCQNTGSTSMVSEAAEKPRSRL